MAYQDRCFSWQRTEHSGKILCSLILSLLSISGKFATWLFTKKKHPTLVAHYLINALQEFDRKATIRIGKFQRIQLVLTEDHRTRFCISVFWVRRYLMFENYWPPSLCRYGTRAETLLRNTMGHYTNVPSAWKGRHRDVSQPLHTHYQTSNFAFSHPWDHPKSRGGVSWEGAQE